MTQIFLTHSSYGLMTMVAAIDGGHLPHDDRRMLLPVSSAIVPETSAPVHQQENLQTLCGRFDEVESLNELLSPRHPTHWRPSAEDLAILERFVRRAWNLGHESPHLFVQSIQVAPARTLVSLFPGAEVTVVGDGLMSYSPIRDSLPTALSRRVTGVVYVDVVPGLTPLLFTEHGARRIPIRPDEFRAVLDEVDAQTRDEHLDALTAMTPATALVCGQYLAALGLLTVAEEQALHEDMVREAAARGAARIVFKPHPSAPIAEDAMADVAAEVGVNLEVYSGAAPAEIVARRLGAIATIAGFSTVLPTVHTVLDIPIASVGMSTLLGRLTPFENSNRIPATIVDAITRPGARYQDPDALQLLVDAVGYAMQPRIMAGLRPRAERFVAEAPADEVERYLDARRLHSLNLAGPGRPRTLRDLLAGAPGNAGRLEEAVLAARGIRRRVRRAWKTIRG